MMQSIPATKIVSANDLMDGDVVLSDCAKHMVAAITEAYRTG